MRLLVALAHGHCVFGIRQARRLFSKWQFDVYHQADSENSVNHASKA